MQAHERRVAVLIEDGVEDASLDSAVAVIESQGLRAVLVTPGAAPRSIQTLRGLDRAHTHAARPLREQLPDVLEAVLIPAGPIALDRLRASEEAIAYLRAFAAKERPIGALGAGVALLAEAGLLFDRLTAAPIALRTEVRHAGAHFTERALEREGSLLTSFDAVATPAFARTFERLVSLRHAAKELPLRVRRGIDEVELASRGSFPASDPPPAPTTI